MVFVHKKERKGNIDIENGRGAMQKMLAVKILATNGK